MTTPLDSRAPNKLRRHPLHRAHVPAPDRQSPEWAAFVETVRADGRVREPLHITTDGLVMDGWWRREAASDLQLAEVPCQVDDPHEAALLIVETLTARKQMTRGAAAYLALGLLAEYSTAAERRRLRNAAAGRTTAEEPLFSTEQGGTYRYLAARFGVALGTLDKAREVRAFLHEPKELKTWLGRNNLLKDHPDVAKTQAALRAEFEPLLFNGEKSLWKVLQAIAGRLTGGDPTLEAEEQLELFEADFGTVGARWLRLKDPMREQLGRLLPRTLANWPDELLDVMERAIGAARKHKAKSTAA